MEVIREKAGSVMSDDSRYVREKEWLGMGLGVNILHRMVWE